LKAQVEAARQARDVGVAALDGRYHVIGPPGERRFPGAYRSALMVSKFKLSYCIYGIISAPAGIADMPRCC
jgi:hypothetical protein